MHAHDEHGHCGFGALISFNASSPLRPGIVMSSTTRPTCLSTRRERLGGIARFTKTARLKWSASDKFQTLPHHARSSVIRILMCMQFHRGRFFGIRTVTIVPLPPCLRCGPSRPATRARSRTPSRPMDLGVVISARRCAPVVLTSSNTSSSSFGEAHFYFRRPAWRITW